MKAVRILALGVLLLLAAAPRAGAQPFKWWQDEKSKVKVGLTDEQAARIEGIFQASGQKMRPAYEEFSRQENLLSALIEKADATEVEVMRQADQVESLRAELGKARTLMLFRVDRVLTPEQRVRLKELHNSREGGRTRPPGDRK